LGIDGGGTCTRAALAPAAGGELLSAAAGPCNWTTLPPADCLAAIDAAAAQFPPLTHGERVEAVCLCSAGYYAPHHQSIVREALAARWPKAHLRLETDLVGAWAAALAAQPGIVLVAGTGSVAYGRLADGREARAGGWGPLFDDEGSGYWLACRGLAAVAKALDGRGPPTALWHEFAACCPELGHEPEGWLRELLRRRPTREEVSRLARAVVARAEGGDEVARDLVQEAADHLARMLAAVAGQLAGAGPLGWSWSGGLISCAQRLRSAIHRELIGARVGISHMVIPSLRPEEGALLLAEAALGREDLAAGLRERGQRRLAQRGGL
jgi:N-acetylglucosamine kinase-like BadF-type ATPase